MESKAQINFITQYIKDLSFENPLAPASFHLFQKSDPKMSFDIDLNAKNLQQQDYEVELKVTASAHTSDEAKQAIFIAEVKYAGIFQINIEDKELLKKILLIECPTLLFPFVRRIIADVTRDSGFPPLLMNPMNFSELYEKNKNSIN